VDECKPLGTGTTALQSEAAAGDSTTAAAAATAIVTLRLASVPAHGKLYYGGKRLTAGRGLHSFPVQLNLSELFGP
jgi:hypothetical protein